MPRIFPTEDFHKCALFYDRHSIALCVDDESTKEYEDGLPDKPIRPYVQYISFQGLSQDFPLQGSIQTL